MSFYCFRTQSKIPHCIPQFFCFYFTFCHSITSFQGKGASIICTCSETGNTYRPVRGCIAGQFGTAFPTGHPCRNSPVRNWQQKATVKGEGEAGSRGQDACQPATAARNPSKGRPSKSGSPLLKHNWGKQGGERSLQMRWEPELARRWWKRPTRPSSWIMFSPRGFHERWWISPIKHITAGLGSHRWKQS